MRKGKIIVIEGTDCSGKQTQTELLLKYLNNIGIKTKLFCFPNYESPTGRIVGGPYLGKDWICEGWFDEGATNVDPKVASLYYAADRRYNISKIIEAINSGYNVVLDRYVGSNMGHQAGKILDLEKREEMINWLDKLEYELLELPKPDITIFLHMPYENALKLKMGREEKQDQHESSKEHLINAEQTFLYLAKKFNYDTVKCVDENNEIKSIDEIFNEIKNILFDKYNLNN